MVSYDSIRAAEVVPTPDAAPFTVELATLAFPRAWREVILDVYRHGKKNAEKYKSVPIRRLNTLIRAYAPDLISTASYAGIDDTRAWLYAQPSAAYSSTVLETLVTAWLQDLQQDPTALELLRAARSDLNTGSLSWSTETIDFSRFPVNAAGTVQPDAHYFRLLPELLAERVENHTPYEYCGEKIHFYRAAAQEGAELISWPPLLHSTKTKGGAGRQWWYSGTIRLTLQTVPFDPIPRIHIATGIRRWVTSQVRFPFDRTVAVYLRAQGPWLTGAATTRRFALGRMIEDWDGTGTQHRWVHGGAERMLARLAVAREYPSPDTLAADPSAWLDDDRDVTAAVTHSTMMGFHGVGAGLMPSERMRLTTWVADALAPHFTPTPEMWRSSLRGTANRILEPSKPIGQKADDNEKNRVAADNAQIALRNAAKRRTGVAAVVGPHGMTGHLLYQNDLMRDYLIAAAEASLGLGAEHRTEYGPTTWAWRHDDGFTLRLLARQLGALGAPLGGPRPPRRGAEHNTAIGERRRAVRDTLAELGEPADIVLIELDGRDAFKRRTTDPKFAIRLGCADADMVSQFLTPPEANDGEDEDNPQFRAAAAWADALRQIGMRFVPDHALGDAIPERLNQVAFWMVKRRTDGPTGRQQFTPIAVLIRPGQDRIMGRTPDDQGWIPYPDLLRKLTGTVHGSDLDTEAQQQEAAAAFFRVTLYSLRNEPTLVITHANNSRSSLVGLQDGLLVPDAFSFSEHLTQKLRVQGRHLRLVRVREDDRDETPQWWAPKDDEHAGLSKGLWLPATEEKDNRVFYSTSDTASTHPVQRDATKLTPHLNGKGNPEKNAGKNSWTPQLLEFVVIGKTETDNPEALAMFVHQQRFPDDYRDALALPLVLHLAKIAKDYALPHEDAEQPEAASAPETDRADQSDSGDTNE